jgi:hypothetical protein
MQATRWTAARRLIWFARLWVTLPWRPPPHTLDRLKAVGGFWLCNESTITQSQSRFGYWCLEDHRKDWRGNLACTGVPGNVIS